MLVLVELEPSSEHLEPSCIQEGTQLNIQVLAVVLHSGEGCVTLKHLSHLRSSLSHLEAIGLVERFEFEASWAT